MRAHLFLYFLPLAALGALPPSGPPSAEAFEPDTEVVQAERMLPEVAMAGGRHRVRAEALNDGRLNHYVVESDYGIFEAHGDAMVAERIREIEGLARMEEMGGATAAAGGARESVLRRWRAAKSLGLHPLRTGKNLPRGVARYFGNYYRMLQGGRGELEEPAYQELIRYSAAKRGLAAYFDVNPYSTNAVLQQALEDLAWKAYAGGAGVELGLYLVPSTEFTAVMEATTTTVGMSETVLSQSPESLRAANKRKLQRMGVDRDLIRDFLRHPWYSPGHETALVDALNRLTGVVDRDEFLEAAMRAGSESEAYYYQRTAEMLAGYHERVAELAEIDVVADLPVARTQRGVSVLVMPADYLRWTRANAAAFAALASDRGPAVPSEVQVWIAGDASPAARREVQALRMDLHTDARDLLSAPVAKPAAPAEPAGASPPRRRPDHLDRPGPA